MARPITITRIEDLAIGASGDDILRNLAGAQLSEPSLVLVYENRESVDVTTQIKIGSEEVKPLGGSRVNATVGDTPNVPTDRVLISAGQAGERVQILGTNVNAGLQEARATVFIIPLVDVANFPSILSNA